MQNQCQCQPHLMSNQSNCPCCFAIKKQQEKLYLISINSNILTLHSTIKQFNLLFHNFINNMKNQLGNEVVFPKSCKYIIGLHSAYASEQSIISYLYHNKINHLMAFVFESQRKINELNKLSNPVGPGQYFSGDNLHHLHSSAPFQSSSLRKTMFEAKQKQKPGPGDYEISQPIIEPNIKSVSNNHSIILKINSTGTAQFKSTYTRFKQPQSVVPGPGQYHFDVERDLSKSKRVLSVGHEEKEAVKKMRELSKTFYERKVPTIPDKYRGLTDSKKEQEIPEPERLGPACYNPNKTFHVNSTGSVWGKDKTKRFIMERRIALGPGQYKADYIPSRPDDKANLSSGQFRSATVRTYFDSLIYHTNLDNTAKQRSRNIFKSKQPAPGQYDYNTSSFDMKDKPFSFQFFGSTVERFSEDEPANQKPRKNAFYNIKSDIGKIRSFNRGSHGFNSLTEREDQFLQVKQHQKLPGPGQYKQKVTVEKKLKGVKPQKFGSTTDRPFYRPEQIHEVGPGKYTKNENVEQFVKTRFGQIKNESSTFKSATARNCFGQIKDDPKFGQYDVSYHDVAKKLERQKMFLQNLKKIQVEKPGFESSHSRFPHYEQPKDSPVKEKQRRINSNKQQQIKIRQENERARSVMIESNRQQLFQKKSNGVFDKQERFAGFKRGAPGAGAYTTQTKWQKKSYNVKYQKK